MTDKIIYLDMDGVITNFIGAVSRLFEIGSDMHLNWRSMAEYYKISNEDMYDVVKIIGTTNTKAFWRRIDAEGVNFWNNLHMYPWFFALLKVLKGYGTVILLSSPSMEPSCVSGKTLWIQRYLGRGFRNYIFCPAPHKHLLAHKNTILIDDNIKNIKQFIDAGGNGILFPQPWNTAYDKLGVEYSDDFAYPSSIVNYIDKEIKHVTST